MEETIFQCSQGDLEEFHFLFPEQNCNSMRPVVKLEDGEAKGPDEAERVQVEAGAGLINFSIIGLWFNIGCNAFVKEVYKKSTTF